MDGYCTSAPPNTDLVIITSRGKIFGRSGIFANLNVKKVLFSVVTHAYNAEVSSHPKEVDDIHTD